MPSIFKDEVFTRAFDKAELGPAELLNYEKSLKNYRDLKNVIETAFDEGKMEGKLEVARKLKASGVAKEIIISTTGLSEEELENL